MRSAYSRGGEGKAEVLELFPKRAFDYTFMQAGGPPQVIVIARALRVIPFYYYWLMVRVHNININAGTFQLGCYNTLPSAEDPREFSSPTVSALNIVISASTPVGLLTDSTSFLGPFFKVVLTATQSGTPPNNRFYAELSAVLYGRAVG
jgi:hypothetical protein